MDKRVITNEELVEDKELNIRPSLLDEYIGQKEVKENINIFINFIKFSLKLVFFISFSSFTKTPPLNINKE